MTDQRHSPHLIDLCDRARVVARTAFRDVVDKAGRPYIDHVERVADALKHDPRAELLALIQHIPDRAPKWESWTFDVPDSIMLRMLRLTRGRRFMFAYLAGLRTADEVTRRVAAATALDNLDPARLARLPVQLAIRLSKHNLKVLAATQRED